MQNSTLSKPKMPSETKINTDVISKNQSKHIDVNLENQSRRIDVEKLPDKELLVLCQKYGTQTILWKRKFIGLLPEVDQRSLYLKKGFSSIYEFGARLAGISYMQVKRVITVDKKLKENGLTELREKLRNGEVSINKLKENGLTELREKLRNGEVSINKLARIVSVANEENESDFVKAVGKLSQSAVETLVRDEKKYQMENLLGKNSGSFDEGSLFGESVFAADLLHSSEHGEDIFVRAHKGDCATGGRVVQPTGAGQVGYAAQLEDVVQAVNVNDVNMASLQDLQKLELDENVVARLSELKLNGQNLNKILNEMLDKREKELEEKLDMVGEEVVREEVIKKVTSLKSAWAGKRENGKEIGRNIPAKVKRVIRERGGTKCEVRGCLRDAKTIHHTIRFGIQRSHDPRHLVQLCKEHHELTHIMDEKYAKCKSGG